MPFPDKILAEDEKVVENLHPHWIRLVGPVLWFVVVCALAGVGIAFLPKSGIWRTIVLVAILVVGLGLICWRTLAPVVRWRCTHFIFTTHRVLIRTGVFTHRGRDIPLPRISDVAFTQTLLDRIVGAGTLTIESAGEHGQETLHDLPHSDRQQQTLNRLIEQDHDRRARVGRTSTPDASSTPSYPPSGYSEQYDDQARYPTQNRHPAQDPRPTDDPHPTRELPPLS